MGTSVGFLDRVRRRRRVIVAALLGTIAGVVGARSALPTSLCVLIGWNVAAYAFVGPTLHLILTSPEPAVRARARLEDEDRFVLTGFILAAVGLSLGAIVFALREAKRDAGHGGEPAWVLGLAFSTLAASWMVVQCLYTLHYAHKYFGDKDGDGTPDGGVQFPGGPPKSYMDFLYVSVCVGATCQVSDINITNTDYRNLVTSQALISFVFNTMVLALGINIIGNLMGQ